MTAVDIDRETAHEAARRELAKPIYSSDSLPQRIDEWIHRLLARVVEQGASVPGGWLTIVVLIALLAASVAVAIWVVRRTIRTRAGADRTVFGAGQLSAAQHRAIAESAAGQQDWSDAIRHRLRAVARLLEEDGILDPAPGRTAGELGSDAGSALPALASEFLEAATIFDDVVYGEHAGTAAGYQAIADLDDRLCRAARTGHPGSGAPIRSASWTPVR